MASSKSPQCDEESLLLEGFEVMPCDALQRPLSGDRAGQQVEIVTYVVQNLDTQLGLLVFQTRNKSPPLPLRQDFSQRPDGFGFIGRASNSCPKFSEVCRTVEGS